MKKILLTCAIAITANLLPTFSVSATETISDWQATLDKARGQTVYFNAWGGSQPINDYLRWANKRLLDEYGVTLKHVKVADIAETTQRILAEKVAGKTTNGSVDLVWINGENFRSMKQNDLLFGPFTEALPNWRLVDKTLPVDNDFTEPTDGLEAPWGVGQFVYIYDTQTLKNPPKDFTGLLALAKRNPGKISYPQPPEFHGTSFLKSALLELTNDKVDLYQPIDPVNEKVKFDAITAPLWRYLDQLHLVAWNKGQRFPSGTSETVQLLDDRQLLMAVTFNPNAAKAAIEHGKLVETAQTYAFEQGALSNIHFLGIPWNSSAKEGALVVVNFLLSVEAQLRKADDSIWGDPSVLSVEALSESGKQPFKLYKSLSEPHPSWGPALQFEWQKRYAK
jgi:putative thiamine transport system substrate-binding protein